MQLMTGTAVFDYDETKIHRGDILAILDNVESLDRTCPGSTLSVSVAVEIDPRSSTCLSDLEIDRLRAMQRLIAAGKLTVIYDVEAERRLRQLLEVACKVREMLEAGLGLPGQVVNTDEMRRSLLKRGAEQHKES